MDSIKFMVDRDIIVFGVGFYGISNVEDSLRLFSVDVEFLDLYNDVMCIYEGSFFFDVNKYVYDILFDEFVIVRGYWLYIIWVFFKGFFMLGGMDGMRDVIVEGVRFWFDVDEVSFNGIIIVDG